MKVALLGNMNNNHFALMRYLRDSKIEAYLMLYDNEPEIFLPENDSFDKKFTKYIKKLNWGSALKFLTTSKIQIESDLKDFQYLIGTGLAPAYLYKTNRNLDIFVPYGADISYFINYNLTYPNRLLNLWFAVYFQKKGLKQCKIWHMDITNSLYENAWNNFRGKAKRWYFAPPMVYKNNNFLKNILNVNKDDIFFKKIKEIKENNDLLFLLPTRHVWKSKSSDPNNKGTDNLLKGISLFINENKKFKIHLITFNYGLHMKASMQLINKLNIKENVTWFPVVSRKKILYAMYHTDVVCCEFDNRSWFTSGVIIEALTLSKVILTYRKDSFYLNYYKKLFYILNAKLPSEISEKLNEYIRNKEVHENKSSFGSEWYDYNIVQNSLKHYIRYFKN